MQLTFDDYVEVLQTEQAVQKCPPEIGARLEHVITQCRAAKGSARVRNQAAYVAELKEAESVISLLLKPYRN